jgi:thiol-disulfide isomerase/thioredoxin|tara:strand:- start:4686 stop:5171 length:486 start_codon:yes stop_codon:yes gene_type:complete
MKKVLTILAAMLLFACNTNDGKAIPDFSFTTFDGEQITQESLRGGATVVCVWATWCGDCIREIPELNDLVEKYKDNKAVNFIALSDEDEAMVSKSLKRFPFNFQHVVNAKTYSDQLKTGLTKHFPQVLVIDKDLKVVYDVTENKDKIFGVLDGHIQKILKQ